MILPGRLGEVRKGVNAKTGKWLTGWEHCVQSMDAILTTRLDTRLMRLSFGSDHLEMIDRPGNAIQIGKIYGVVVQAIHTWEPGYRIVNLQLTEAGPDGKFQIDFNGDYYPRGHLGDYSIKESRTYQFVTR